MSSVQSTLKDGLKQNADTLSNLEKQIAELKEERGGEGGFNRTASFKFDEYRASGNNESLINQLNGSSLKNSRGDKNYASFNQRIESENSNIDKKITKEQQKKMDNLKKLLNNQEISNTE